MKTIYQNPELEIVLCFEEDILTLSNGGEVDANSIDGSSWNDLINGQG